MPKTKQPPDVEAIRERWAQVPAGPWCDDLDGDDGVIRVWFAGKPGIEHAKGTDLSVACVIFPGDMETYEGPDFQAARAIAAAPEDIAALLRAADAWKLLAEARDRFMVAYRTGGRPPESAFADIARAKKVLGLE